MCQDENTDSERSHESYRIDWTEYNHPSTAVVETVARATDCDQTDLDPLYQYLDGDDLDTLLLNSDTALTVSFIYEHAHVEISSAGWLTVRLED